MRGCLLPKPTVVWDHRERDATAERVAVVKEDKERREVEEKGKGKSGVVTITGIVGRVQAREEKEKKKKREQGEEKPTVACSDPIGVPSVAVQHVEAETQERRGAEAESESVRKGRHVVWANPIARITEPTTRLVSRGSIACYQSREVVNSVPIRKDKSLHVVWANPIATVNEPHPRRWRQERGREEALTTIASRPYCTSGRHVSPSPGLLLWGSATKAQPTTALSLEQAYARLPSPPPTTSMHKIRVERVRQRALEPVDTMSDIIAAGRIRSVDRLSRRDKYELGKHVGKDGRMRPSADELRVLWIEEHARHDREYEAEMRCRYDSEKKRQERQKEIWIPETLCWIALGCILAWIACCLLSARW